MRITKRNHACLVITENDQSVVIDPGSWTAPLDDVTNVVAVVLTHEHADHWSTDHLADLRHRFPQAPILGPAGVRVVAGEAVTTIHSNDVTHIGPFDLRFYGDQHAEIHRSIPRIENLGVVINDAFAYGGDALVLPPTRVGVLAVPASAPWLKMSEVMDFIIDAKPEHTIAVHDALLSPVGSALMNKLLGSAATCAGASHHALAPGEHLDI